MPNPFDQFDKQANPFDQFDSPIGPATGTPTMGGTETGMPKFSSEDLVRPTLEMGGLVAGATIGAGVGPVGGVAGGGLGYAAGKQGADLIYGREREDLPQELMQTGKDVLTGAEMEAGGQILGKAVPWVFNKTGEAFKAIHGRLTGVGKAGTEAAIESGKKVGANPFKNYTDFDRALRGKISGDEVVQNAQNALRSIKDSRSAAYTSELEKIKLSPGRLQTVRNSLDSKLQSLVAKDKFDIKINYAGGKPSFDFSDSTLVEGQPVIEKALKDVTTWSDNTAAGLDTLKKRISTYAGQVKRGTPQESFLTQLENSLSNSLKKEVPGYANMTKGYAEATKLIKDIESGLMMRKQGMTGRIVADQTLRRLMSSMKDNFALRRELVEALAAGGEDVLGQTAGYAMRSPVPLGLAGTGPALIGNAALAKYVSPAFWPVLAASSPRVSAEFLRMFGKTLSTLEGTGSLFGQALAYELLSNGKKKNSGGGEIQFGPISRPGLKERTKEPNDEATRAANAFSLSTGKYTPEQLKEYESRGETMGKRVKAVR